MAILKIVKAGKTKQSLKAALNYISQEQKITLPNNKQLLTPLNCWGDIKNIYKTMIQTKEMYRKAKDEEHSEMYKHFQQSFKPQEISPQKAHEIGIQWAQENFAKQGFELCICTHIDTEHIHNHFIINSVNAITGKTIEIHANKTLELLKHSSDNLCKKYGLSIIERTIGNTGTQRTYKMQEHYTVAHKIAQKLTWQYSIYERIVKTLKEQQGKGFASFKSALEQNGIEINYKRIKHDLIFKDLANNKKISDQTLNKHFADENLMINREIIEKKIGEIPVYIMEKNQIISEKKQGFYKLIENLLKAIENTRTINTKIEFYSFMEKQGWLIRYTDTGKAFYNIEQDRYIYDNTIYKITKKKQYCLSYIEEFLN